MSKKIMQMIPSIVLYICAGLLGIYTIWAYTHCTDIISQAKLAGQLATSGNEYDIASFYMGNCGQYFVFTLLLVAAGLILQKKQPVVNNTVDILPVDNKTDDDELDDWFNEANDSNG
jgi:hypothetical protein